MVAYRYLGSATTDANGIAKYNFTGSGAGEVDYIASLDNPITDGSIVSNTYEVTDATFYDKGILNDPQTNNNWYVRVPSNTSITRQSDGTLIEWSGTYGHVIADYNNSVQNYCTTPFAIEFDLLNNENGIWQMYNGSSSSPVRVEQSFSQLGHYKIINTLTEQYWYCNGTEISSDTKTFDKSYFAFLSTSSVADVRKVKYANFVMYPI